MANIGEPVRRHTVIPLTEPVTVPEGPVRLPPSSPSEPATPNPSVPSPTPVFEPVR